MSTLSQQQNIRSREEQKNYLNQLLQIKPMESYPEEVLRELKIISLKPKESVIPFGSYIYRMQPFAGDIDGIQHVNYINKNTTIRTFIRTLKKLLRNLDKNNIYSEFKAGLNYNYVIDIGKLENGIFTPEKDLLNILKFKHQEGLFNNEEYFSMIKAISLIKDTHDTNIHSMVYTYIFDLIRNKKILRWSKKELLNSYKIVDNVPYSLADALKDETIVKIDLISLINNKFVEVTNILFLGYPTISSSGQLEIVPVNISEENLHSRGLSADIEKFYYSNKFYSPFKSCKRIYAEMRQLGNFTGLDRLAPIIRGETSLLYQIKSQIDTFLIILKKIHSQYYLKLINNQLQEIKGRLNYVLGISQEQIMIFSKDIDKICNIHNIMEKINKLDELNDTIKHIIEYLTIIDMNKQHFNPIPNNFLPSPMNYDPNLVRKPTDNPTEVYKQFIKLLKE
jgi:hypothetical protein